MGSRGLIQCLVFTFLYFIEVCLAQEPRLVILPEGTNQIKPIGANIVLTCRAEVPDLDLITDLRWLGPDGRDLPTGDRISSEEIGGEMGLFIRGLQEADSGNYNCTAVYASSQRLTTSVRLSTIVGITWEDAPTEQSAVLGKPYKVRCVVRANPLATVDWVRNGHALVTNNEYVIENDGVLIREVRLEDETFFTCRARVPQTGQLDERKIRVEVLMPPEFSAEPHDVQVTEGETAVMQCTATGKPDPTYTWVDRDNQNVQGKERFTVDERTGQLTITEVRKTDAGTFKCLVENQAGKTEKSADLEVIVKPQVVEFLNTSAVVGKEATLICKASGEPLPEVTFMKEGSDSTFTPGVQLDDDRIIVDTSREGEYSQAKLIIRDLLRSDDGLYACIGRNSGGEIQKMGHLTVEFPPSFATTPMREAWSWGGRPTNLTCRAEAIPNATVIWYLASRNVENDPNILITSHHGESILTVSPVDGSYYGTYRCQATNLHGKAEHAIQLKEARTPGSLLQVKFETVTATTVTFQFIGPVDDGGLPVESFAVQYKLEGQEWPEKPLQRTWPVGGDRDNSKNIYHSGNNFEDTPMLHRNQEGKDYPYILENLEPQTTYVFRFAAKNQVGYGPWDYTETRTMPKRSAPEEPTILASPSASTGIVVTPYSDKYELIWTAPPDNGEPIDYFQITYYQVRNSTKGWEVAGGSVDQQISYPGNVRYEMKNLSPDTVYRIELRAHNSIGNSPPAEILLRTAKDPTRPSNGAQGKNPTSAASDATPGSDGGQPSTEGQSKTATGFIIGVIVAVLIVILVLVDVTCYCVNKTGVLMLMCVKCCGKSPQSHDLEPNKGRNGDKTPLNGSQDKDIEGGLVKETASSESNHMMDRSWNAKVSRNVSKTEYDFSGGKTRAVSASKPTSRTVYPPAEKKELIPPEGNGVKKSASKSSVAKDSPV